MAGCTAQQIRTDLSRQIQVFGVELNSGVDYRKIDDVVASEEPCLKGYERFFEKLDISIGYGSNRKIRKITTRNSGTSIFGISPRMTATEGERRAIEAGFQNVAPSRYQSKDICLTLLVDGNGTLFGITVENRE